MSLHRTKKTWVINPDGTQGYLWNPISRSGPRNILNPTVLIEPYRIRKPSRILICQNTDLFSPHNKENWVGETLFLIGDNPQHDFIIVTDFAKSLLKWNRFIPDKNVWLAVRINQQEDVEKTYFMKMTDVRVKFILIESLKESIELNIATLDWIVIDINHKVNSGSLKRNLQALIDQAKSLCIPVFMAGYLLGQERIKECPTSRSPQ